MAQPATKRVLHQLQRRSFSYFLHEGNPANGLVPDRAPGHAPCSIAAVGFALACYPSAVERGFMKRRDAIGHTLASTRFFAAASRGGAASAPSHRGFFYHFLDMKSGARTWQSELSTIDTGLLLLGCLCAAEYFDGDGPEEREIRANVDEIWRRVDWRWALKRDDLLSHGWRPETGFLRYRWRGYNEGLILYVLGLASPEHPLPASSYHAWTATYDWKTVFDHDHLYAGPLFIHQYPHAWIDFRGI